MREAAARGRGTSASDLALDAGLVRTEGGALLEQWVALELLARASYLGPPFRVSFWRTAGGADVDLVWAAKSEDIPVEVESTDRPRPTDARHLERFLDDHRDRAHRGLLVCRCPEPQQLTRRVLALPWSSL